MSLLTQSSLVLIPSGYKEDTVYSVIPNDATGDLSFTRASDGTRINSDGLVENTPWNLMSYSEQFNNAFWNIAASGSATFTVTANQTTAPNDTLTADLITITRSAITELSAIYTSIGQGLGTFKNSIWLKAKDGSNVGKTIDLWSWEGVTRGYTMITLTADWVRYEQDTTVFSVSGAELFDFGLLPSSFSTSTTLAVEFYAWGGQSNIGSTAKPYFPTTDRLNVPRLTYQNGGGGCPSLLLEPQRTNLALYSQEFDNASWTKNFTTITANSTTSPDGTTNAETLTGDATNTVHFISGATRSVISGTTYSISIYAKKNTNNFIQILGGGATFGVNVWGNFDLNNGVVGSIGSSTTASIVNAGNGWYRCTISGAAIATGTLVADNFALVTSATSTRAEGNTLTTSIFIWGAQLEAGSYATSYIPTVAASATRIADACSKTGISSLIGQTEGVWFLDFTYVYNDASYQSFMIDDNVTISNKVYMYRSGTNTLNFYVNAISIGSYSISNNTRYKIAFAYKSAQHAVYINGTSVLTSSNSSSTTALNSVRCSYTDGSEQLQCPVNQILLFPTRLTNAELVTLTTI